MTNNSINKIIQNYSMFKVKNFLNFKLKMKL